MKRMCIKTLPKVLAIHLKRFDYDWERSVILLGDFNKRLQLVKWNHLLSTIFSSNYFLCLFSI